MADKAPSSKRGLWFKAGKAITILTLCCFFLPFFGVSCDGVDVVTVSGADMVAGCEVGGLMAEGVRQGGDKAKDALPKVPIEPLAIVALATALGAVVLSFQRSRKSMTGVAVCSTACIGALIGLWIKVGGDLKDTVGKEMLKKNGGDEVSREVMKDTKVDSGARFGLFLVCFGMLASVAMTTLALKEPEGTELPPPPPAPPGTPPGPPPGYAPGGGYPPNVT